MKISNILISSLLFTAVSFAQDVETPAQPERPELTKEDVKERIKNRHAKVRQEMEGMTKEERQEFKAGLKEQAKARRAERKAKVQAKLENMTEAERAEFKEKRQARKEIRKDLGVVSLPHQPLGIFTLGIFLMRYPGLGSSFSSRSVFI